MSYFKYWKYMYVCCHFNISCSIVWSIRFQEIISGTNSNYNTGTSYILQFNSERKYVIKHYLLNNQPYLQLHIYYYSMFQVINVKICVPLHQFLHFSFFTTSFDSFYLNRNGLDSKFSEKDY